MTSTVAFKYELRIFILILAFVNQFVYILLESVKNMHVFLLRVSK